MGRLFNMDNKFFQVMGRIADLLILNLLFLVCCIPVITIGPSLAALHYVLLKMSRNEESYLIRSFFKSFKENFRQGVIINLILLAAALILYVDFNLISSMTGMMAKALYYIFLVLTLLFAMMYMYVYPLLAKFYNSVSTIFKNSMLMAIRHLPYTLLCLVISVLPFGIFLVPSYQAQATLLMLFFLMGCSLVTFINDHFFVKIFDNYIPDEEEEASGGMLSEGTEELPGSSQAPSDKNGGSL